MRRTSLVVAVVVVVGAFGIAGVSRSGAQASGDGWKIPAGAENEKSPLAADDAKALAQGKKVYESKCQRCHGPQGSGNGPDADPDRPPGNLTDSARAGKNPDGVMFYKVWNGREKPKMPAFKTDLSKEDAWAVIAYAKTLRK